jgi:hypothetical protein
MTQSSSSDGTKAKPFNSWLPLDPIRFLIGLRQKWLWFILLPSIFAVAGGLVGLTKTENRFSVSLQLLRAEVPSAVQASQEGNAFKPRELSDETLLAVTYASEVMNAVGSALDPVRSGNTVKSMVEISKQRGTDFFYITAHSRITPEDAIRTVQLWADEIVEFTRTLQRRESEDMHQFLTTQGLELSNQLATVNRRILEFSEESEFYDAEQQTNSYLSSLENLQMRQAESRIELQSKEIQIDRYRDELRNQSPLFEELRRKQQELTFLQGRYTDDNPLVKEKIYEISFLEERLAQLRTGEIQDLKEFTGSDLGNNLYLEILSLENERIQLSRIVETYDELISAKRGQVASLPRMQMNLTELNDQRQQLLNALALIDARKKEAEFYINNPPGYWKIFQSPELRDVAVSAQPVKAMILGAGGFAGGIGLALLIAVFWELRQKGIRSPLQGAIATRTRPVLHFQSGVERNASILVKWKLRKPPPEPDNGPNLLRFWLTELARSEQPYPAVFFQAIESSPVILRFWHQFLDIVGQDKVPIVLLPLDENDLADLPELPEWDNQPQGVFLSRALINGEEPGPVVSALRPLGHAFIVSAKRLRPQDFKALLATEAIYYLMDPEVTSHQQARFKTDVIRTIRGPGHGLILTSHVIQRSVPGLIHSLEMAIFQHQSRTEPDS